MIRMIFCLVFVFLLACNNTAKQIQETDSAGTETRESSNNISGCYLRVLQRDTLAASLQQVGNTVTGRLTFDNYQKDGSSGSVNGELNGNILKLVYSFQSEGMNSVMHVYFKVVENGLIHGIGEVAVKGDTAYFKDTSNISYPVGNLLTRIPCDKLPAKYK